ncbi:MAG: archease [bacterium]|nr:archease [bacterium]
MSKKRYRTFSHTADLGLEIFGQDESEIFANAGIALYSVLTEIKKIRGRKSWDIEAEGHDWEDLLVNFLSEILYRFDTEQILLRQIVILKLNPRQVAARGRGEIFDPSRHPIKTGIKAVTHHQASIKTTSAGFAARVILDI